MSNIDYIITIKNPVNFRQIKERRKLDKLLKIIKTFILYVIYFDI